MAVAIPLLLTATGASAAIGAAIGISTAMATTLATIAFAVTGVSAKVDKVATGVFGRDLVQIGNIFGAAYGAVGGGFGGESMFGAGEAVGAIDAVNGADFASDSFSKAAEATGYTGAGDFGSLADLASTPELVNGHDASNFGAQLDSAAPSVGDANPQAATNVVDKAFETTSAAAIDPSTIQKPTSLLANSSPNTANTIQATDATATAAQAPVATQAGSTQANATMAAQGPGQVSQLKMAAPTDGRNVFEKILYKKDGALNGDVLRTGGELLSGVGKGYDAAQKAQREKEMFEQKMAENRRVMNQGTGLRATR